MSESPAQEPQQTKMDETTSEEANTAAEATSASSTKRGTRSRKRAASPAVAEENETKAQQPASKRSKAANGTARRVTTTAPSSTHVAAAVSSLPTPSSHAALHRSSKGEVLAIGSGDCSQLGLGTEENMRERKKPTLIKALLAHEVISIAAGSLHNLALDSKYRMLSWGCNDDNAIGRTSDEWLPEPVDGPLGTEDVAVVQIACGASHSIALSKDGVVYSWGTYRDANGVIGFSDTDDTAAMPRKLEQLENEKNPVVMIAAGEHHDVALLENGDVYQWGDIGIGRRFSDRHKKNKLMPSRVLFKRQAGVTAPKHFIKVFAGGSSSFALDETGQAWFWGPANYGQGGVKATSKSHLMILIPQPVLGLPPIQKVAASLHHSLFLSKDGDVYSVGRGEDGRLGHGALNNLDVPKKIEKLSALPHGDRVVDVNCGECHSLIVTKHGRLYTFGYGDLLQLGTGETEDVSEPYLVTSKELDEGGEKKLGRAVVQAVGGSQHSIMLTVQRTKPVPGASMNAAPAAATATPVASPVAVAVPPMSSVLAALKPKSGWTCDVCAVQNSDTAVKCAACESDRPGTVSNAAATTTAPMQQ